LNVLILCTGNSARSIMAEAILNRYGSNVIHAFSAGSTPRGTVNPLAIELLQSLDYRTDTYRSKSWDEFSESPHMDVVITVCDNAANEVCPIWPGTPVTAHWGIADPDQPNQPVETQRQLFKDAYTKLESKINRFIEQGPEGMDNTQLKLLLDRIGES
jgi:arsenate reductase